MNLREFLKEETKPMTQEEKERIYKLLKDYQVINDLWIYDFKGYALKLKYLIMGIDEMINIKVYAAGVDRYFFTLKLGNAAFYECLEVKRRSEKVHKDFLPADLIALMKATKDDFNKINSIKII